MEDKDVIEKKEGVVVETTLKEAGEEKPAPDGELAELRDRYVRLYAEFDNYKKRVQKDREELLRNTQEDILYQMLPVIDNLEMALDHSSNASSEGVVKGVEMTLREFQRVAEKFGLTQIAATGKPFDPSVHHAMAQVERADLEDQTVVEEYRKGYLFRTKVLRPSLVAVSRRPVQGPQDRTTIEINEDLKEE